MPGSPCSWERRRRLAIALAVTGCPAAVSSAALAPSLRVSENTAGSYPGRGTVPSSASGGTPRSTSTICRCHHSASRTISPGSPSRAETAGITGRCRESSTAKPSADSNPETLTLLTWPPVSASRTPGPEIPVTAWSRPPNRTRSPIPSPPGRPAAVTDYSLRRQPDSQVRRQHVPPQQVEQRRQDRQRVTRSSRPGHQRGRLREDLQQHPGRLRRTAPPMPVPRQPRDVRRPHRTRDPRPDETPPGQPARPPRHLECLRVPGLDPVIRAHVDDHRRTVLHPGEIVRRVTSLMPVPVTPAQPERLRRDRRHLRIEIQQHHEIPFQPRLVPDVSTSRSEPPQARHVSLAPGPPEPPDGHELLGPQAGPRLREIAALNAQHLIEVTQLELRISVPGRCGLHH